MGKHRKRNRGKQRTVEIGPTPTELVSVDGKKRKMVVPPGVAVRSKARR